MAYQWNDQSTVATATRRLLISFLILMTNVGGFASSVPQSTMRASLVESQIATSDTHRLTKRMDLESCLGQFDVHKNTIIRTGESQAIGGKYLQGLELETLDECQRLCCETETCDVFIFENKNYAYCYLFDCGPPENFHCKFTRHANYTSAVLTPVRHIVTTPLPTPPNVIISNISQQEWELTSLKVKPEVRIGVSPEDGGATSLPAMQQVVQVENGSSSKAVNAINQMQPHVCGRFQFPCHSGECIAIYNACDGIPQCDDGSDEGRECSESVALKVSQPVLLQQQLQSMKQHQDVKSSLQVNNREDSAAWANRKIVSDSAQRRLGSSGDLMGLGLNRKLDTLQTTFPNANLSPREPMYVPIPPLQNGVPYFTQAQNVLGAPPQQFPPGGQLVSSSSITWPQPGLETKQRIINAPVSPAVAVQVQPQGHLQFSQQRIPPPTTIPVAQKGISTETQPDIVVKTSHEAEVVKSQMSSPFEKAAANEYEDYMDSSTEPPKKKQHKHRKTKVIEKEAKSLEKIKKQSPMQEQYKIIHENMASEFRDHEGFSTRPGGAVISLFLGLLITAALAILIGCRMRTVGRRVRRTGGKTPYDADFLVNGMYL